MRFETPETWGTCKLCTAVFPALVLPRWKDQYYFHLCMSFAELRQENIRDHCFLFPVDSLHFLSTIIPLYKPWQRRSPNFNFKCCHLIKLIYFSLRALTNYVTSCTERSSNTHVFHQNVNKKKKKRTQKGPRWKCFNYSHLIYNS